MTDPASTDTGPEPPAATPLRCFDAAAVARALPWPALLEALRQAFVSGCEVPARHVHAFGAADTALLMPAWRRGGRLGVKTVLVCPGNGALGLPAVHASYALFSAATGVPLAVIDGSELTARRTAAVSALAAHFLARADVHHLLVVGAGRVAALLPAAMRSARPTLRRVTVWNRSPAGAEALAALLRGQGLDASASSDLETAVRTADVVSCATLADAPLVHGDWLAAGSHLDLIGSFTPAMREADGACFARGRVFVDTEDALAKSGDLLQAVAEGHFQPRQLQATLAGLCRGDHAGRQQGGDITLFKSVGTALADLAAAELVLAGADNPAAVA